MTCEFGLATDTQGCEVCSCKRPMAGDGCTDITRAVCPLMDGCKFGLATNEQRCPICKCKQSIVCNPLPSCSLSCLNGLATDAKGCDICVCKNTCEYYQRGLFTRPMRICFITLVLNIRAVLHLSS
nr:cysteine-rich motor neuron 1 protein-like [Lytechinus pictus]